MRRFYIGRDKYGWKYRENSIFAWSRFDDSVIDNKSMQSYFQRGNHDPVGLIFTDEAGHPKKIIEVKRNGNRKINIVVNAGERNPYLTETDFISSAEQYKFYSERQTDEIREEALKLNQAEAVKFFKEHADLETLDEIHDMVASKMSDEGIINVLKTREGESEFYFIE